MGLAGFLMFSGFNDYLDEKQINIAHFKQGFGGAPITHHRGVKYFDKKYLKEDIDIFADNAIKSIISTLENVKECL